MTDEIKPCPFCGSDAALCLKNHDLDTWYVACTICGAMVGRTGKTATVEAWNARTDQAEINKASHIIVEMSAELARLRAELEKARAELATLDISYKEAIHSIGVDRHNAERWQSECLNAREEARRLQALIERRRIEANDTRVNAAGWEERALRAERERDEAVSKIREHAEHVNYYGALYSQTELERRNIDEQREFYKDELAKAQTCADEMAALAWKWKYKADCQRATIRALVVAAACLNMERHQLATMDYFPGSSACWLASDESIRRVRKNVLHNLKKQADRQSGKE